MIVMCLITLKGGAKIQLLFNKVPLFLACLTFKSDSSSTTKRDQNHGNDYKGLVTFKGVAKLELWCNRLASNAGLFNIQV
jgi:hypothetical protein